MLLRKVRLIGSSFAMVALVACGGGKTSEEHLALAQEYLARSEPNAAIIELKNALKQDSEVAEARWLLGKIHLDAGDYESAEKELRRARSAGWPAAEALPALAETLLLQGKYVEVRELAPGELPPPAMANLLAVQALSELAQGEINLADTLIQRALIQDPESGRAKLAQARVLAVQGDVPQARLLLDDIIAADPKAWSALSLQGELQRQQRDWDGALKSLTAAIELRPHAFAERVKRALVEIQLGDFEAAQTDADSLLQRSPRNPMSNYVQGLIHFQNERYQDAIISLAAAEGAAEQYPLIMFFLGTAHLKEKSLDQAGAYAARFHNAEPDAIPGRKLLAAIRLQQRRFKEVRELLGPALDASPDDIAMLNMMASAALAEGSTDEGIALLSKASVLQPDSAVARVRLGASLMMSGNADDAEEELAAALELDPEFQQADILLVLGHLEKKEFKAAVAGAEAYVKRHPANVTPYNLLGKVQLAAEQPEKARSAFEQALKLEPADPAANHNLAYMELADNNIENARAHYNTVLKQAPDHLPTLLRLAELSARLEDESEFVRYLRLAMEKHPGALAPRLVLAQHYLESGRPEQVETIFTGLGELQKKSPQVLVLRARAQLAAKDYVAATNSLGLLSDSAGSAAIHHLKAIAAAGMSDGAATRRELEQALKLDQEYLPARIALARIALTEKNVEEFDQHVNRLAALAPETPVVMDLQALRASRSGDYRQAVSLAEKVFKATPTTASLTSLANYHEQLGDTGAALKLREQWVNKHGGDVMARMALADQLQRLDRGKQARENYQKIVRMQPDNVVALNNLAWNLRADDPTLALDYARRALAKAPESSAILDTLAMVEYHNKDFDRARRSIAKALQQSGGNPSIRYHSAVIDVAAKMQQDALRTLESLIAEQVDFPERNEAVNLLAELKGG